MSSEVGAAIETIQTQGYARLSQVFTPKQVESALLEVRRLHAEFKDFASEDVPFLNRGQHTLYNLQNKSLPLLRLLLDEPAIARVLIHFLNDTWYRAIPAGQANYIMRAMGARSSCHALPMHIDSFVPYMGDFVIAMQCSIVLEDQRADNGGTLFVPGSHQNGRYAHAEAKEDAVLLEAQAGDVVFWDSRVWHGTTENTSGASRWALVSTFARWWIKQQFDHPKALPAPIFDALSAEQKSILGYCSVPPIDERAGIDMKQGYDVLGPKPAAE